MPVTSSLESVIDVLVSTITEFDLIIMVSSHLKRPRTFQTHEISASLNPDDHEKGVRSCPFISRLGASSSKSLIHHPPCLNHPIPVSLSLPSFSSLCHSLNPNPRSFPPIHYYTSAYSNILSPFRTST